MMYNKQSNVLENFYKDLREMTKEDVDEDGEDYDQIDQSYKLDTFTSGTGLLSPSTAKKPHSTRSKLNEKSTSTHLKSALKSPSTTKATDYNNLNTSPKPHINLQQSSQESTNQF